MTIEAPSATTRWARTHPRRVADGPNVPLTVTPPAAVSGQPVSPGAVPHPAPGETTPHDPWAWLRDATAACGCCAALVENERDLRQVRARHPEEFTGEPEPARDHPNVEIEHLLEQARGLPAEEREHGLIYEAWL